MQPELEQMAQRLGLNGQVVFLGPLARAELPALLAQADVVVLPSYWEGLPVALIEALSAGVPIVASRVGGNPELVGDCENGYLVPPGDADALAAALLRLAQAPDTRVAMRAASRQRYLAGGFTPEAVTARHVAAYQRAHEERGGQGGRPAATLFPAR
jgi:glycosyltransferase involved in cell wall biosynthesis